MGGLWASATGALAGVRTARAMAAVGAGPCAAGGAAGSTMVAWQISHTVQVLPWPSAQVDVGAGVDAVADAQWV